jgi:transcriptional regulator with XRE-family HTH domain
LQIPRLREWRELRGLTQVELAKKAGLSPRSVAGYEAGAGARPPSVRKLAEALDVEITELVRPKAGSPRSLRKFLMDRVGHSYLTDHALEELERVDDTTQTIYDQEYVAFLNETHAHPKEGREHVFDVPYRDVVLKYSTVLTAYRMGWTIPQAVEVMRRDLAKEGFEPRLWNNNGGASA